MPFLGSNNISGVYDIVYVDNIPVLASNTDQKLKMKVDPLTLMQGTPKTRIMNVGGVSEDITVSGPVLTGGAMRLDARNLMVKSLNKVLDSIDNNNIPSAVILNTATVNVDENGATINLSYKSDGNPNNKFLKFYGNGADSLPGTPLTPSDTIEETRQATFYDFRIIAGGYELYFLSANISINIQIEEKFFIAGVNTVNPSIPIPGGGPNDNPPWNPANNPNNFNTQFPFLFIKGMTINGGGKAVVVKQTKDNNGFWNSGINGMFSPEDYKLTLQEPCKVNVTNTDIRIEIFTCGNVLPSPQWVSLFYDFDNLTEILTLGKGFITAQSLEASNGIMESSFEFSAYVL